MELNNHTETLHFKGLIIFKLINNMKDLKKESYIVNGKTFSSYDEVIDYCKENNYHIQQTQTVKKGKFLIFVNSL